MEIQRKVLPVLIFILVYAAIAIFPSRVHAGKRVALVIGNGNYPLSRLGNTVNDARDMAAVLKGLGFEVVYTENADKRTMTEAVDEFCKRLRQCDVGMYYFAGYGVQFEGRNYLLPVASVARSEFDLEAKAVDAGRVLSRMQDAGCNLNIVVLDACRHNPFYRSSSEGLAVMRPGRGALISYATSPGSVTDDGPGGGIFTKHLLRCMKIPGLNVEAMFRMVRNDVLFETGSSQMPWVNSSLGGNFFFVDSSGDTPPPQPQVVIGLASVPPPPLDKKIFTDPVTNMEFVWVPGGCFQMGSNDGDSDEKPVHKVCVDGFWIGKYEVTQGQWQRLMGNNPSHFKKGDDYPVEKVYWNDVQKFIRKLNSHGNGNFRLPTEAEWEYACRSGGKNEKYSGGEDVDRVAWYMSNSVSSTHRVGTKAPNGLGLYDMSGNVWEWCQHWYGKDYYSQSPRNNPQGPSGGSWRVFRGGSWSGGPRYVRCALRNGRDPGIRRDDLGFRLVRLNDSDQVVSKALSGVEYGLTVNSTPSDARVRILNIEPRYEPGIRLSPGRYHVEVSKAGYETKREWVEITDSDRVVSIGLVPPPPPDKKSFTDPVTNMEFVWVPGGCFQMGQTESEKRQLINEVGEKKYKDWYADELPRHEVCVDGFWMGKYEVTQGQWKKVMGNNPSRFKGERNPVETVSWNDVQSFIRKLNVKGNGTFRLPTEAEWEYAARGGTTSKYWWGDSFSCDKAMAENDVGSNEDSCVSYVRGRGLTPDSTAPVGSYPPNPFGLYDTAGNVWEWCEDVYDKNAYSKYSRNNPIYTGGGSIRVNRGGCWNALPGYVRCAFRGRSDPGGRGSGLGFRLVRTK